MSAIENVPAWLYRYVKSSFDWLRMALFTQEVEQGDIVMHSEASVEEIRDALGDAHFTNSWELSYNYKGEDLNMRRPLRKDDEYEWYQTHLRAFERTDGTVKLEIHEDIEPTEHPYYHLNPPADSGSSDKDAIRDVSEILDDAGISYKVTY